MKRIVSLIVALTVALLAMASIATAGVPQLMHYQGHLTDEGGAPLDTIISMTFTIYDDSTGPTVWWIETQPSITVANGLFNVLLGSVNPILDTVFADTVRWLGIKVGDDAEISPRTKLVTVPYAFRVSTVDGAAGGAIAGDLEASGIILASAVIAGDLEAAGTIIAGGPIMSGNSITIDGTSDMITATSGLIDFDDEILVTMGGACLGGFEPYVANLYVEQTMDFAAVFLGDVMVTGFLMKEGGGFKIDHPLDPENKYLNHSFVESPDMKNVYDGVVTLDASGEAVVELPGYFETVNMDFRYQLTCIGGFAPVYVAEEIFGNQFAIAGGEPGMKISWQVTGIRKDPVAELNRLQVEVDKPPEERGTYLSPEAYGLGEEYGIYHKRHQRVEGEPQEKSVRQID